MAAGLSLGFLCGRLADAGAQTQRVVPLVASGETVAGERIVYPTDAPAKITAAIVTLAPGETTGWHTHGVPTFGYILEGEISVDYGAKGSRTYRAGEAVLEAIDVPHEGRNTGTSPMRILAVFIGVEGRATTVPAAQGQ